MEGIPFELDREALRLYFQFGYLLDPSSPFEAIRKLTPGSWLTFDATGKADQQRYWTMPAPAADPPSGLTREDACQQMMRKLLHLGKTCYMLPLILLK
jgi:asparagine synthetase B (glutamine-hydrolysing)